VKFIGRIEPLSRGGDFDPVSTINPNPSTLPVAVGVDAFVDEVAVVLGDSQSLLCGLQKHNQDSRGACQNE
jgi:hypothetical protein